MYAIGTLIVGIILGYMGHEPVEKQLKLKEKRQEKAICEHFGCNKNDFTYFWSEQDDIFIATVNNSEYHIKFSQNQPIQVVFSHELELIDSQ